MGALLLQLREAGMFLHSSNPGVLCCVGHCHGGGDLFCSQPCSFGSSCGSCNVTPHPALFQHGPVFTVCALGKRFTFVTEDEGAEVFFTSKDLNFEQAVQRVVENAGKGELPLSRNHTYMPSSIKGQTRAP